MATTSACPEPEAAGTWCASAITSIHPISSCFITVLVLFLSVVALKRHLEELLRPRVRARIVGVGSGRTFGRQHWRDFSPVLQVVTHPDPVISAFAAVPLQLDQTVLNPRAPRRHPRVQGPEVSGDPFGGNVVSLASALDPTILPTRDVWKRRLAIVIDRDEVRVSALWKFRGDATASVVHIEIEVFAEAING